MCVHVHTEHPLVYVWTHEILRHAHALLSSSSTQTLSCPLVLVLSVGLSTRQLLLPPIAVFFMVDELFFLLGGRFNCRVSHFQRKMFRLEGSDILDKCGLLKNEWQKVPSLSW
jgi:hypothetical protein